jgi:hypothetical protein
MIQSSLLIDYFSKPNPSCCNARGRKKARCEHVRVGSSVALRLRFVHTHNHTPHHHQPAQSKKKNLDTIIYHHTDDEDLSHPYKSTSTSASISTSTMTSRALVVGSGAIGLRTAEELLRRGVSVILQAPRHPLHPTTCSVVAGGLWMPVHCNDPRTNKWALESLNELFPLGLDDSNDLVEILPVVDLKRGHSGPEMKEFVAQSYQGPGDSTTFFPEWTRDPRLEFQHM